MKTLNYLCNQSSMKFFFPILLCFLFFCSFSQVKNDSNLVRNGKDVLVSFGKITAKGSMTKEEILKTDSLTILAPNGSASEYKIIGFATGVEELGGDAEEYTTGNRLSERQKNLIMHTQEKHEIFIESITVKKNNLVKKLDCSFAITVTGPK